MSGPRKRVEAAVQQATVAWVRRVYPSIETQATMNENSKEFVAMGLSVGITDLFHFLRGHDGQLHVLFHELKTLDRKSHLSPAQTDWYNKSYVVNIAAPNTEYAVSFGFEAAKETITKWYKKVTTTLPTSGREY